MARRPVINTHDEAKHNRIHKYLELTSDFDGQIPAFGIIIRASRSDSGGVVVSEAALKF